MLWWCSLHMPWWQVQASPVLRPARKSLCSQVLGKGKLLTRGDSRVRDKGGLTKENKKYPRQMGAEEQEMRSIWDEHSKGAIRKPIKQHFIRQSWTWGSLHHKFTEGLESQAQVNKPSTGTAGNSVGSNYSGCNEKVQLSAERRMSGRTCPGHHCLLPAQPSPWLCLLLYLGSLTKATQPRAQAQNWLRVLSEHKQILLSFSSSTVSNKSLFQLAQGLTTINFERREWRPCNFSTNCKTVSQEKTCPHFHLKHTYKPCIISQVFLI